MKTKAIKLLVILVVVSICAIVYAAKEVRWDEADKYYGQTVTVTGKVVDTHNSGKACFLNFHQNWKRYFTAVIFASDFHKFPANPENHYLNKEVKVTGFVKEYKGKPEIILKDPSQIIIVEQADKVKAPTAKKLRIVDGGPVSLQEQINMLQDEVAVLRQQVTLLEAKVERLENLLEARPQPLSPK